jgi:small multidrug resistance pump
MGVPGILAARILRQRAAGELCMQWVWLCFATVLEIAGTAVSKSEEWSAMSGAAGGIALYILSAVFFILAIRRIELSVAFAVCSALATLGVAAVGILYFREPVGAMKLASLVMIAVGIFLLNLSR